ncbi:MAG: uracil-DNA glycosylase family protein [Pseudomonadota bacterium]|nr:uracil-DNA glycosylase family protein [Pseudomonadota bacterium]MEC8523100.1 uracil-DNA glycosylase family protein [Pseudomonadota bacterium]
MSNIPLIDLLTDIRNCDVCAPHLPLGANPVIQVSSAARILIIGQAPGTRVHASGIPWNDPSGNTLREWLNISSDVFYDDTQLAIMPMGLCYPGKGKSGDLPPRKECAPQWHDQVLEHLPDVKLTLLIGQYAQKAYLKDGFKTLTERVMHASDAPPPFFPLPHPSPRNRIWLKKNPWFENTALPELRKRVNEALGD